MIAALSRAALQDAGRAFRHAVAVGATGVRVVLLEPSLCRLVGHKDHTVQEHRGPIVFCVRCGSVRGR